MNNHSQVIGNELFVTSSHRIEITTNTNVLKDMEYTFSAISECGKLFLVYNSPKNRGYKQLAFMAYDMKD